MFCPFNQVGTSVLDNSRINPAPDVSDDNLSSADDDGSMPPPDDDDDE